MLCALRLAQAIQCPTERATAWLPHLCHAMAAFDIDTPLRQAMFLTQVALASRHLTCVEENPTSTVTCLASFADDHDPRQEPAHPFEADAARLSNALYAHYLGNGDTASGDGHRFHGRGLLLLTGRARYAACGTALNLPLLTEPDRVSEPPVAALSAAWLWHIQRLNTLADAGHFHRICALLQPGPIGLAYQTRLLLVAQTALASAPSLPNRALFRPTALPCPSRGTETASA